MRKLYVFLLSPFCRKVRLACAEKGVGVDLVPVSPGDRAADMPRLDPPSKVPILREAEGDVIADSGAICEYLEQTYPDRPLLPGDAIARAEVRRLVGWFDGSFRADVTDPVLGERVMRRLRRDGEPDSERMRAGMARLPGYLTTIGRLAETRNWLAGDALSLADFAAAAHVSCLDYLGAIPWDEHEDAALWYARVKSRPAFRGLLADHLPGLPPAPHYADLDF